MSTARKLASQEEDSSSSSWLNLSLGASDADVCMDASSKAPSKVFSCNFCMRKFYSSQALVGHQNAHKRERGLARRTRRPAAGAGMGLGMAFHPPQLRSLAVHPHALVHIPVQTEGNSVARFEDHVGSIWPPFVLEEAMEFMWPGSFHVDPATGNVVATAPMEPELERLDLSLGL